MKKFLTLFVTAIMFTAILTGCSGNDDTIQTCIVSNTSYSSQNELEAATKKDALAADQPIFASIHFVESPKGMEYSVKWYLDGTEIKSETKATENDAQDIVVYELEAEQAVKGTLKLEVIYKDEILLTEELKIQ